MDAITDLLNQYPVIDSLLKIFGVILLAIIVYFIVKKILIAGVHEIVKKTKTDIDDILLNDSILKRIAYVAPILVVSQFLYLVPEVEGILRKFTEAIIVIIFLLIVGSLINAGNELYEKSPNYERRPIKGYLQIAKIVIYILGGIAIIGLLTGQQPWTVLTGVGAFTAILIIDFKDASLSFVGSIHISA